MSTKRVFTHDLPKHHDRGNTANPLCNNCFGYLENCKDINCKDNFALLGGAFTVRMQCLVPKCFVFTIRMSLY